MTERTSRGEISPERDGGSGKNENFMGFDEYKEKMKCTEILFHFMIV